MNALPRAASSVAAIGEAITWALLLVGMFLKYVTETTELGVSIFGMVHGVVFIAFCLTTVLVVGSTSEWPLGRLVLGLAAAVPPFATLLVREVRRSLVACSVPNGARAQPAPTARSSAPRAGCCAAPLPAGSAVGAVAGGLTGLALLVGPPA